MYSGVALYSGLETEANESRSMLTKFESLVSSFVPFLSCCFYLLEHSSCIVFGLASMGRFLELGRRRTGGDSLDLTLFFYCKYNLDDPFMWHDCFLLISFLYLSRLRHGYGEYLYQKYMCNSIEDHVLCLHGFPCSARR